MLLVGLWAVLPLTRPWRNTGPCFASVPARLPGRREAVGLALASGLLGGAGAAQAVPKREVSQADLDRIKEGYNDLVYLMANWNKLTRKCDRDYAAAAKNVGEEELRDALLYEGPDPCTPQPDEVRKFLGGRSVDANLYNTEQLWIGLQMGDQVPTEETDRFQSAAEEFEKHKNQVLSLAWTGIRGESGRPAGSQKQIEDILLQSKGETELATKALGEIVQILKL